MNKKYVVKLTEEERHELLAMDLDGLGLTKPQLAELLIERMTDYAPIPPELEFVRYTCAISIAREGFTTTTAARIGVVALDEGINEDERAVLEPASVIGRDFAHNDGRLADDQ